MAINKKKLLEIAEKEPSPWLEEARQRDKNRPWLQKSGKIALRVLRTLKESGLTQKELAEKMEVSPQYVNKIVTGKENLSLETITKLEAALGISLIQVPEFKSKAKTQVTTEEYTAFSSGTEITTEFHLESGETEEWDGDDEPEVRGAA